MIEWALEAMMARILLVEDDEATRYATVKLLSSAGHEVVEAHDYRDALPVLEDGSRVDLLVVDVILPGVHGFALARMARVKHPGIKCIHVTGFDLPTSEASGPVLRKPLNDGQLLSEIATALP
jgi:CheY-like chemotaxis protein